MEVLKDEPKHSGVNLSRQRPFIVILKSQLKELLLPDDPFRHFAGLPPRRRAWSTLSYFIPILQWAPNYTLSLFPHDLLSGITIASLSIPQGISYAKLADIPPIIGLYSSFVPPLVYAAFGSSNSIAVGTLAGGSLLLYSSIKTRVSPQDEPDMYLSTMITATFFAGVLQLALGIFRMGVVVDFLSRSATIGFITGTAIIVILQQLKGLLGLQHFTTNTDVVSVLRSVFQYRQECQWQSTLLGLSYIALLLAARRLKEKKPKLFWVNAICPLFVVVTGGLLAFLADGKNHGIPIVGDLQKGINPISISRLQFRAPYFSAALTAGLIAGIIALAEGIAIGQTLSLLKKENTDGNKEMVAFGLMNIVGSFTSCCLTSGTFSKSSLNHNAGCKTPVSNIVMAMTVLLVLLLLAPLFKYTPQVALAAVIVSAMIGLIELEDIHRLFRVDKFDFFICTCAFFGVLFFDLEIGLFLPVGLSILRALLHVARPSTYKLGNLSGTELYLDIRLYPDLISFPSILILQLGSPMFFINANYLRERIIRWVEAEENDVKGKGQELHFIIFEMGGVASIDNSGIGLLLEVHRMLRLKGIHMALTSLRRGVVEKLMAANFIEVLGKEWIFISITKAVSGCFFVEEKAEHSRP